MKNKMNWYSQTVDIGEDKAAVLLNQREREEKRKVGMEKKCYEVFREPMLTLDR